MKEKIKAVYDYIQQRCLWQFVSRNWDREENIKGIMSDLYKLHAGEECDRSTMLQNSHYADAKELLRELKEAFPWMADQDVPEFKSICEAVKAKLLDTTVVHSLNEERTDPNY